MEVIDIYSKNPYPANVLSNFYANNFVIDGVECACMEGFLQSLKYRSAKRQIKVCRLTGNKAKKAGLRKFLWKLTGTVHWQGKKYYRDSTQFEELLLRAYSALYGNRTFYEALLSTKGKILKHTSGKHDKRKTILTEEEFIGCLEILRGRMEKTDG